MLNTNQTLNAFLGSRRFPRPRTATEQGVVESAAPVRERDGTTRHLGGHLEVEKSLPDLGQPLPTQNRTAAHAGGGRPDAPVVASELAGTTSVQNPGFRARRQDNPTMTTGPFQQHSDTAPRFGTSMTSQGPNSPLPSFSTLREPGAPENLRHNQHSLPPLGSSHPTETSSRHPFGDSRLSSEPQHTSSTFRLHPESASKNHRDAPQTAASHYGNRSV